MLHNKLDKLEKNTKLIYQPLSHLGFCMNFQFPDEWMPTKLVNVSKRTHYSIFLVLFFCIFFKH